MGNTFFYRKAKQDPSSLTWKEIFSESFKSHSKSEYQHALAAGTVHNTATEANMLQKWDKPWIWFKFFKAAVGFVGAFYVLVVILGMTFPDLVFYTGTSVLFNMIPPLVMPLVILIFLWEMNIPKNMSIYECIAFWLIGAILSLVLDVVFKSIGAQFGYISGESTPYRAPVFEEPAKLVAIVLLLIFAKRNRKIYGITGLIIGACVGAGFGAFESAGYSLKDWLEGGNDISIILHQVMRGVFALGGHTLFAAPYGAAIALNMKNNKFSVNSFLNTDLIFAFIISCAMHFIWNYGMQFYFGLNIPGIITEILVIVILWAMLLWMLRKCLNQVVSIGRYVPGSGHGGALPVGGYDNRVMGGVSPSDVGVSFVKPKTGKLKVVCVNGPLKGHSWRAAEGKLTLGRSSSSIVRLPDSASSVSRNHCVIYFSGDRWKLKDMNSSCGTFLNNHRVNPDKSYYLNSDDTIYLADRKNVFKVMID